LYSVREGVPVIPKTFILANRKWTVSWLDEGEWFDKNYSDEEVAVTEEIRADMFLRKASLADVPAEYLEHTFEHELHHAIWFAHGWDHSEQQEHIIDGLAGLRCQFKQTSKGEI